MYKKTKRYDLGYYNFIGTWAWIIHRLSGLALIFYVSLHLWVINTLTQGPEKFNNIMNFLSSPLFKYLEIGLWGIILFHAFNGVRIIIIDFFKGSFYQKKIFFILITIAFLMWATGSYILISHIN
ncbi:MAG: succinate dehydrogenase, cytochrome b556 subunit [Candidatus Aminicenantes bacterium]|nr:succinate dehydrogenase, cytochrome b556 subunit [Candidatus Aminicenantes bacterium]